MNKRNSKKRAAIAALALLAASATGAFAGTKDYEFQLGWYDAGQPLRA